MAENRIKINLKQYFYSGILQIFLVINLNNFSKTQFYTYKLIFIKKYLIKIKHRMCVFA